jgi:hypothetical protein
MKEEISKYSGYVLPVRNFHANGEWDEFFPYEFEGFSLEKFNVENLNSEEKVKVLGLMFRIGEKTENKLGFFFSESVDINQIVDQIKLFKICYWIKTGLSVDVPHLIKLTKGKVDNALELHSRGKADVRIAGQALAAGFTKDHLDNTKDLQSLLVDKDLVNEPFFQLLDIALSTNFETARSALIVSSIEALLLPGIKGELSERFSERAAFIAYSDQGDIRKGYEIFRELYKFRSTFYHGEKIETLFVKVKKIDYEMNIEKSSRTHAKKIFQVILNDESLIEKRLNRSDSYKEWNNHFLNLKFNLT